MINTSLEGCFDEDRLADVAVRRLCNFSLVLLTSEWIGLLFTTMMNGIIGVLMVGVSTPKTYTILLVSLYELLCYISVTLKYNMALTLAALPSQLEKILLIIPTLFQKRKKIERKGKHPPLTLKSQ